MRLVLTADVDGLGSEGDIVDVAAGYGRNYLLPRGKAKKATSGTLKEAEGRRSTREKAQRRARDDAEAIAASLTGNRVVIAAQAGDEGKLFGSIGPGDIVEGVRKFTGMELDRKAVRLDAPIKSIGLYEVTVHLHAEVEFSLTLDVIPA